MFERIRWLPTIAVLLAVVGTILTFLHLIAPEEGAVLVLTALTLGVVNLGNR